MSKEIKTCFVWYANKIAETVQYNTWSDEFCRKYIKESTDIFLNEIKKYINWDHITKEEASELRFGYWCDDLYLIPLYLLPIIPIGTKLITIFGEEIIYDGTNVDNDIRFGCIAYGIKITN